VTCRAFDGMPEPALTAAVQGSGFPAPKTHDLQARRDDDARDELPGLHPRAA